MFHSFGQGTKNAAFCSSSSLSQHKAHCSLATTASMATMLRERNSMLCCVAKENPKDNRPVVIFLSDDDNEMMRERDKKL